MLGSKHDSVYMQRMEQFIYFKRTFSFERLSQILWAYGAFSGLRSSAVKSELYSGYLNKRVIIVQTK